MVTRKHQISEALMCYFVTPLPDNLMGNSQSLQWLCLRECKKLRMFEASAYKKIGCPKSHKQFEESACSTKTFILIQGIL